MSMCSNEETQRSSCEPSPVYDLFHFNSYFQPFAGAAPCVCVSVVIIRGEILITQTTLDLQWSNFAKCLSVHCGRGDENFTLILISSGL